MANGEIEVSVKPADLLTEKAMRQLQQQANCPYCHGSENDPLDTRVLEANEDGQVSADYEYTIWVNLYGFIPKLQIESDDFPMETVPITYCPKCGRRLDDRDV